MQMKIPNYSNW